MNRLLEMQRELDEFRAVKAKGLSLRRGPSLRHADRRARRAPTWALDLRAKHTFAAEQIAAMKDFLVKNATGGKPDSCIDTMNTALARLFADPTLRGGSRVDLTMQTLAKAGRAGNRHDIEFLDAAGTPTTGLNEPDRLSKSICAEALTLANNEVGWSVFGLSVMDGYHSVLLTIDNSTAGSPKIYWSDQWATRGGWQEFAPATLDAEVERLTRQWWVKERDGLGTRKVPFKFRTRATLWRVLGSGT